MNGFPRSLLPAIAVSLLLIFSGASSVFCQEKITKLPAPRLESAVSVEQALQNRRTVRTFRDESLSLTEISQLLWAAQGITGKRGDRELRTAPSAGAIYGLETYLVAAKVQGLEAGLYHYNPKGHELVFLGKGDFRDDLCAASLGQTCVKEGVAIIVFAAVPSRVTEKYKERGQKFAILEAGHASQNVYLQAEALGLGTVAVGSFTEGEVRKILNLPADEEPMYLMPVGKKRQ